MFTNNESPWSSNENKYLSSILSVLQHSSNGFMNDYLLTLYIDYLMKIQGETHDSIESLLNMKSNQNNHLSQNYIVENYYQYIFGGKSILNSNGDVIEHKYFNNKDELAHMKNTVVSKLEVYFKSNGYDFCISQQMNCQEYNILYNNISNKFNFSDQEIQEKIKAWGNITKTYVTFIKNEPGKNLGSKLAYQSTFSNHELFFIKSLVATFSSPKNDQLYGEYEGGVMVEVEAIQEEDEYYLITVFKLLTNLAIIEHMKFPEFIDALKNKDITMPSLEVYSYTLEEIEQSYSNQYKEFQQQQLQENAEENNESEEPNTKKDEIYQLRLGSIKAVLNQLVQQQWFYRDPSKQYRTTVRFQMEFDSYFDSSVNCRFCKKKVVTHQGVICKECRECGICLDCTYSFLKKNKLGLNKKDNSIVDGKWCPGCSAPWREENDISMFI